MYNKILVANDVLRVCVGLGSQGRYGRQSPIQGSRASVKGKLGGQAWLTRVSCLVRLGLKDYGSGVMSLGGPWQWSEAMARRSQDLKIEKVPSGTVEESCKVRIHQIFRCREDVLFGPF